MSSLFSLIDSIGIDLGGDGLDRLAKEARWVMLGYVDAPVGLTHRLKPSEESERGPTMPRDLFAMRSLRRAKMLLVGGMIMGSSLAYGDVVYQQDFEGWNGGDGLWSTNTSTALGGVYTSVLGRFDATTVSLDILATTTNTGGYTSGGGNRRPFNLTVDRLRDNKNRVPHLDQSGGGGPGGGVVDPTAPTGPSLNIGQAIQDQSGNNGAPMFGPGTYSIKFDLMLFDSWDGNYAPYGPDSFMVQVNGQTLFDEKLYGQAYGSGLNFRDPDETPSQNVFGTLWGESIYRNIELLIELTQETDMLNIDFIGQTTQSIIDESWGLDNIRVEQLVAPRSSSVPEVPVPGTLVMLGGGCGLLLRRNRSRTK